jgi:purine-binding chemotaxis protein CheW
MSSNIARKGEAASVWGDRETLEVLTFDINGETFALDATLVQEIVDVLPETKVPGSRAFVSSVINFRGKVIPLADIRLAFEMEAATESIDSRVIVIDLILNDEATMVGLKTDKVNEVTTLEKSSSEAPPSVGMRWRSDYIECLVKRNGAFLIVPDLEAIFLSSQGRA